MRFGEFFSFSNKKENGRTNDGGTHQAVPEVSPGDSSYDELIKLDIQKEKNNLKKEIDEERNSLNPDLDKVRDLQKRLNTLETEH